MTSIRQIILPVFIALSFLGGCSSEKNNSGASGGEVVSADIIGFWTVDYISGTSHPMVGGVMEFTEDGRMVIYDPSGKKEEGKTVMFWHLLRMESGQDLIAQDSTFSTSSDFNPVLEEFEMPMALVLDGDKMTWNLLTRDSLRRASPSETAAYKFTRK